MQCEWRVLERCGAIDASKALSAPKKHQPNHHHPTITTTTNAPSPSKQQQQQQQK